eukprot:m.42932 g.42932  ORF g.42932 m.42932 type:complete len:287 (-) comp9933_c1_seq1:20-880(-)
MGISPGSLGLLLALYNANVTTDWVKVEKAASDIPIRAIVPAPGVVPPDPGWGPTYPSAKVFYDGVQKLKDAGVEVFAYLHLRNISRPCCTCCASLEEVKNWIDTSIKAAPFDGIMFDNMDAPFSSNPGFGNKSAFSWLYKPVVEYARSKDLGVWANGPQILDDKEIDTDSWKPYLELTDMTILFEWGYSQWLTYNKTKDLAKTLDWQFDKLGGVVLNIPENDTETMTKSLIKAKETSIKWLYPSSVCKHTHTAGCTYSTLPSYWDSMVDAIKHINNEGNTGLEEHP